MELGDSNLAELLAIGEAFYMCTNYMEDGQNKLWIESDSMD